MQLLKSRNFGEYIGDTFTFFKENGVHYLTNYFIINIGFFLLFLMGLIGFLGYFFGDAILMENSGQMDSEQFFRENIGMILLGMAFLFIIGILFNIVSNSFTPVYFELYNEHKGKNFTSKMIFDGIKSKFTKGIKYMIGMIILAIPLLIVLSIAVLITICTIVGVLIPIAAYTLLITFTLYEYYFKKENRFFKSFSYAWELLTSKFWHAVGAVAVISVMVAIIQQILSLIIEAAFGIQMSNNNIIVEQNPTNVFDILTPELVALMSGAIVFGVIISFILNTISYISFGIIYYSLKQEKENLSGEDNEVDFIGTREY